MDERIIRIQKHTPQPETRRLCFEVMREAILELLPQHQRGQWPSPRRRNAIFERARDLLETLEVEAADEDDRPDVDALLIKAFRYQISTYNRKLAGEDVWHDQGDLIEARKIWAHQSNAWIAQYTCVRPDVVREAGARAHLVRVKQIITRDGAASTAAIVQELSAHDLPNHPAFVAALVRMLTDMKLITCTDARYWPGRCQRWALRGRSEKLPFVLRWLVSLQTRIVEDIVDRVLSVTLPTQEYSVEVPSHLLSNNTSNSIEKASVTRSYMNWSVSQLKTTTDSGSTAHIRDGNFVDRGYGQIQNEPRGIAPVGGFAAIGMMMDDETLEPGGSVVNDWDGTPDLDEWDISGA